MKLKLNLNKASQRLQAKKPSGQKGHILLVDDEQENLDGLQALLESEGYMVSSTTLPEEALKLTQNQKIDLIISDQRMPIMLGTELLSAIKSNSEDNVRVILTGHTDMNDLITCINNGLLYRYLVKPWRREELLSVVEEGMKKIKIERTIHRLVPEQVWDRLYAGRLEEAIPGEGQLLNCVAMFIDIRDFTSLSSKLTPSQVFYLLTEVMSALSPHIRDHNGYIDKFLGDGALVIFDHAETHARDALNCAKTFEQVITNLNSQTHDLRALLGDAQIRIGVGMHLGSVMLGTVGSWDRLEFTILGDMVNIASRIETRTKHLGDQQSSCVSLCSAELIQAAQWDKGQSTGLHKLPGIDTEYELFRI